MFETPKWSISEVIDENVNFVFLIKVLTYKSEEIPEIFLYEG